MIIKNKRKITSIAVVLAVSLSSSAVFAEEAGADAATSEIGAEQAETTANGRDAPKTSFADILESSSIFDSIDIGIAAEVDIELPKTRNNSNKTVKATEKPIETTKPDASDVEIELNAVRNGTAGTSLTWKVGTTNSYIWNNTNAARYLLFEGSGAMYDYTNNSYRAWQSWLSSGTPVSYLVFDGNITHIGDYAFYGATALEGIVDSVDDIVKPTWPYTINIPDTVTSICSYAFGYATSTYIWNIPNSVTEIGSNAFLGIHRFATVIIDNYKDAIPGAPWGTTNDRIIWLRGMETEPDEEEPELSKYNLQISNAGELDKIEDWDALSDNGNGTYTSTVTNKTYIGISNVPATGDLADGTVLSVTSIAGSCFEDCTTLDSTVDIANSVTAIGSGAFSDSSAATLSIDNFPGAVSGTSWGISNLEYLRDFSIASIPTQTYTGSAITPSVSITLKGTNGTVYTTLVQGTDYTVSYSGNTNAGTATANITYINDYSCYAGTHNQTTFSIAQSDISGQVTVADLGSYPYTGSAIEPEPFVRLGTKTLVKNVDYVLSYSNNINASYNAICTITFIGGYSGSVNKQFSITENEYTITYSGQPVLYNFGYAPYVDIYEITLHCADGAEFVGPEIGNIGILEDEWASYNVGDFVDIWCSNWNPELANHGVYVDGAPVILTLPIEKFMFTQGDVVDMSIETYGNETLDWSPAPDWARFPDKQCTGQEIEILFDSILWCGEFDLTGGYDFTCTFRDNISPGTGYVVINFNCHNPNIGGTIEIPFSIVAKDIGDMVISGYNASYTYTGSYIRPAIRVTNNGAVLTKDTDYTISITNNLNAGIATIIVTGINAYDGTATAHFSITPKSGDDVSITPIGDVIFSGIANTPGINIIDNNR